MPFSPGVRCGPYEIVSLLGAGGMGEVYRARNPKLGRDVAVKVLSSFSEAARENAESRIFIGIHFRNAVEEGIEHGRKIGQRAATLFLRPVQ